MKKLKYIVFILILLLLGLVLFLFDNNNQYNSIVFIESVAQNSLNKGMGFVYKIDDNISYILTNYHVIENSDNLYVYNLNNEKANAYLIDYDSYSDIAILKIEDDLNLKVSKIGANNVKENDKVYYFNINKNGIESGTVLSLDNEINISADYGNSFYKATSIKGNIIGGNSGGPIFNNQNEVIGIVSFKDEDNSSGYYISIDYAIDIVRKLENQSLIRPNLGAIFANSTNIEILEEYDIDCIDVNGVVVLEVIKNYSLDSVGIVKGDVITKINNTIIENVNDLQREIYLYNIGDIITIEYYSDYELNKTNITLKN